MKLDQAEYWSNKAILMNPIELNKTALSGQV